MDDLGTICGGVDDLVDFLVGRTKPGASSPLVLTTACFDRVLLFVGVTADTTLAVMEADSWASSPPWLVTDFFARVFFFVGTDSDAASIVLETRDLVLVSVIDFAVVSLVLFVVELVTSAFLGRPRFFSFRASISSGCRSITFDIMVSEVCD